MVWLLLLWFLSLFILTNQVLLPIYVFTWQQFIKNDESNETIQSNMISQILGLLVLVFLVANGTTFFDYSTYKVIDVCIEWLFSHLAITHLSVVVNFGRLYWTYQKPSITKVYKVKRKLSD